LSLRYQVSDFRNTGYFSCAKSETLRSGVFETVSRDELKVLIDSNGGKVVSSISAKTSYVVAGANMGPSKRTKAETLKVPIISEPEFLAMLG